MTRTRRPISRSARGNGGHCDDSADAGFISQVAPRARSKPFAPPFFGAVGLSGLSRFERRIYRGVAPRKPR